MIDVLVVSHACLTAVNRVPYRRLADRGWRVEIVTAEHIRSSDITRAADPKGAADPPMHFLPFITPAPRFWMFKGLRRVLDDRRPRIVILDYDPGTLLTLMVGWWLRGRGAHVVCFSYDNMPRTVIGELRRGSVTSALRMMLIKLLSAVARPFVDHVWVLSDDSIQAMEQLGFRGKVGKIPLGFDPSLFQPDLAARERVRRELGLHTLTFAYFGRLVPEKGVHLLLEALHALRAHAWALLLDKFADYPHAYEKLLASRIDALGIRSRVTFIDAPHDRIADYMNAADVVVLPSLATDRWKEQYGRVAPEAMACGKLVIVSDSGALPELVGEAGWVVPHGDVGALTVALQRVLNDTESTKRYEARASERALNLFSLPVQVRVMEEVFSRWIPLPAGARAGRC